MIDSCQTQKVALLNFICFLFLFIIIFFFFIVVDVLSVVVDRQHVEHAHEDDFNHG